MKWPLKNLSKNIPEVGDPGDFGYVRSYYIHMGIDLYCEKDTEVIAIEDGKVILIDNFTGEHANPPTPHWNNTWSVLIEGKSGVIGYCEITTDLILNDFVKEGDVIGKIMPVLKAKNKFNVDSMLHLEHYKSGTKDHVHWELNQKQPDNLLNPRDILNEI